MQAHIEMVIDSAGLRNNSANVTVDFASTTTVVGGSQRLLIATGTLKA